MKSFRAALLAMFVIGSVLASGALSAAAAPARTLCLVCKVKHGEAVEEPVKAVRTYEGTEYGFCSEACARDFDADPAAYIPPVLPRLAPSFTLVTLAGSPLTSELLKGQVVLLDFWATWCAPCRKSMPELQALHTKYALRGFTVVGVSIDEGDRSKVKKYVTSKRFTYPIAVDTEKDPAWESYRVKAIPAAFLLDRQGRIVAQWTGAPANMREVEKHLETLLKTD